MIPSFRESTRILNAANHLHQELATEVAQFGKDFSDLIVRMVAEDYHTTAAEVREVWIQSEADAMDRLIERTQFIAPTQTKTLNEIKETGKFKADAKDDGA